MLRISEKMRFIHLTNRGGAGVACDKGGVTLGPIVLIKRLLRDGQAKYTLEQRDAVAEALSLAFGDTSASETAGYFHALEKIADRLNRGDIAYAMILALLMRLPEISDEGMAKLDRARHLVKYSPDQPRVPAGNPDGGQWTSEDATSDAVAQAIPMPLEGPIPISPRVTPIPQEVLPPPIYPLLPHNPYPDDPDCVAQWAHAEEFCQDQLDQGKLVKKPKGKGYSGFGDSYEKCLMGMVSERCGGNPFA